jgi:hypothetical protein
LGTVTAAVFSVVDQEKVASGQTSRSKHTTAMRILRVLDFEPVEESPRDDTGTEESLEE